MSQPNQRLIGFLQWFCPEELLEAVLGDLVEQFDSDCESMSIKKANRRFAWNIIRFFHPYILMRNHFRIPNTAILKSHFTLGWRNALKNKWYAATNLVGLSTGLAVFLLINAYTSFEKSFDQFHDQIDLKYRVNQTLVWSPEGGVMGSTPPPLGKILLEDYPEIEEFVRINTPGEAVMRYEAGHGQTTSFVENAILAADSNFFSFFTIPLLHGEPQKALSEINQVVLSQPAAHKYFGDQNPIGRILYWGDDKIPLTITGVARELPENMHFSFDFLLSMPTNQNVERFDWSWVWTQMVTYVRLHPQVDPEVLEKKFTSIADKYVKSSLNSLGIDYKEFAGDKGGWNFYLQPVRDIHLHSRLIGNRLGPVSDINIVRILTFLSLLVLVIAMINFVNLTTAKAGLRAREIGIKKSIGVDRASLIQQYLTESIFWVLLCVPISMLLLGGFEYMVRQYSQIDVQLSQLYSIKGILLIFVLAIIIGLIAGIYPALYLSKIKPVGLMSEFSSSGSSSTRLRNVLVSFQLAISIGLMAAAFIVIKQASFMNNKDLGFEQNEVLVLNHIDQLTDDQSMISYRDRVSLIPGVRASSLSMDMPGRGMWEDVYHTEGSEMKIPISQIKIDETFLSTMDIKIIAGRGFEKEKRMDLQSVIVNTTTAALFGWTPQEALGKKVIAPGDGPVFDVIGVVSDFHMQSLHQPIAPMMFTHILGNYWGDQRVLAIKYSPGEEQRILQEASVLWEEMNPATTLDYTFYDEELEQLNYREQQLASLVGIFCLLSILITLVGLVGLIAYTTDLKKKEIGIRKILGASVMEVYLSINFHYIKLSSIAFIVITPLVWWLLQQWLNSFAYHTSIGAGSFVLACILTVGLAMVSVFSLTWKASSTNPVEVINNN